MLKKIIISFSLLNLISFSANATPSKEGVVASISTEQSICSVGNQENLNVFTDLKISLDPSWADRATWPSRCQLDSQTPQPLQKRELCLYRCKNDTAGTVVQAYGALGGKCPKWVDSLPTDRWIFGPRN